MATSSEDRPLSYKDTGNEALTFFEDGEASKLSPDNPRFRFQDIVDIDRYVVEDPKPWMESYNQWNVKLPQRWQPKNGLGVGGYTITGHRKYHGTEEKRDPFASEVRDVVIKQQPAVDCELFRTTARSEEEFMLAITRTGSRHFPQLYDILHRDVSTGSFKSDNINAEVQRLIMEFIGGGTLWQWMDRRPQEEEAEGEEEEEIDEGQVWSIFVCLAIAISVLDCGKENGDNDQCSEDVLAPWKDHVILHGDIKPDNIFLDEACTVSEHSNYPRVVLDDLSVAAWIPRNSEPQSHGDAYFRKLQSCMFPGNHMPPEVKQKFHSDEAIVRTEMTPKQSWNTYKQLHSKYRKLGSCTSVWELGEVIWLFLTKKKPSEFRKSYYSKEVSIEEFEEEFREKANCSKELRSLVMRCPEPVLEHRPTPQHVVRDAIDGLRQHEPKCAEAAEEARLKPRRDRLLRKAKSRRWDPVLPTLPAIYLEDGVVGFAKWYEKHHWPIEGQQSAEPIQIEIDNGKPDPVIDDAPNDEIPVFRAVPSTVPNDTVRQLPVDDVLGPALPREIPRPRVSLPRDNTDDGRTGGRQSSSPAVQGFGQAPRSPLIHVKVNVYPWCAGADVDDISALQVDLSFTPLNFAHCRVKDLHVRVVGEAIRHDRQPIMDNHHMYRYTVVGNDDWPLRNWDVLGDVPGQYLNSGYRRLDLNLNLKSSLLPTDSVMRLDVKRLEVECCVSSAHNRQTTTLKVPGNALAQTTIKKLVEDLVASLPPISSFDPSKARVKLRDQSDQYIYDGQANVQSNHGNQLVAPYCIAGEFRMRVVGKVAILRLDIEVQPPSGARGQLALPTRLVADNFFFLVRVDVRIHLGQTEDFAFACRRGTRLRELREGVSTAVEGIRGNSVGYIYFQHMGRELDDDGELLKDLLPENGPASIKIVADYVLPFTLVYWPQDEPSQACPKDSLGFWDSHMDRNETVCDLKDEVRRWRTGLIEGIHRGVKPSPGLKKLKDKWAEEDEDYEIEIRVSGPDDAMWRGLKEPLEDDMLMAEIDFTNCTGDYPSMEVERRLDVLFKRYEDEVAPKRSSPWRDPLPQPENNSPNCQPLKNTGTLTAPRRPDEDTPGATSSPGAVPSTPTPLPRPRALTPRSPSPLIPLQDRIPSPVQSSPPRKPTPATLVVQRRPSEVSDPSATEDEWFSAGSIDEEAKSEAKVRCFRKGQRSITYRCAKKDVNDEEKTTNTLKEEIMRRGFYKPNVKAPMLRIRRPDLDQDLGDNEPLSNSLPGGMRQLICIAGDYEKGFPPVPPGLEEPVQEPLREPVEDKPPPRQDEEPPVVPEPLPEESGDSEADFSDRSEQPKGPKKKDIKIRCIREGYRPITFRTYKHHQDANKNKSITHVTQEIIESGIYGPEDNGFKLETSHLILHEKRVMRPNDTRIPSNTSIETCLQTRGKSIWCRMKLDIARKRAQFDAESGSAEEEDETSNTRRPGDETAWCGDNSDNDDAEVVVRCFCNGKASCDWTSTKASGTTKEKNVTDLKKEIIAGLGNFYPVGTEYTQLDIRDPTLPGCHVLPPGKTLRRALEPPKRFLLCIPKKARLEPDPFPPDGKAKAPEDKPDNGKTGNGTTRKRSPETDEDGNGEGGEAQAPAQKRTKTGKSGKSSTGQEKKTPVKKTTASKGKTGNSTTRKKKKMPEPHESDDEDGATQAPAQKKMKTGESGKGGTGQGKKPFAKKTTDSNGDNKNIDADDEDEDGEVGGPRTGTKRKRTFKK